MRIVVEPEELGDLHKKMRRTADEIDRLGRMLEGVWRSVDYQGSQRGSLDATWAEIASLFAKLTQQYEEMAVFLNRKSNDFATADGQEIGFKVGALLKWGAIVLGTTLDFVPVVGNVKGIVDAALGRDIITGQKLSTTERALSLLGPAGKAVKTGAKVVRLADDVVDVVKQADNASDVAKAADHASDAAKAADHAGDAAEVAVKHGDDVKATAAEAAAKNGDEAAAAAENAGVMAAGGAGAGVGLAAARSGTGGAGHAAGGKGNAPYSHIPDSKSVGPGKKFTQAQKQKIIEENLKKNGGTIKSDLSGKELVPAQKSQKGVKPSPNEVQIDHINPKSKGGSNSNSNAQVLSREENRKKSNK